MTVKPHFELQTPTLTISCVTPFRSIFSKWPPSFELEAITSFWRFARCWNFCQIKALWLHFLLASITQTLCYPFFRAAHVYRNALRKRDPKIIDRPMISPKIIARPMYKKNTHPTLVTLRQPVSIETCKCFHKYRFRNQKHLMEMY